MKYSYPDSLITLAAAITQACSLHTNKNNKPGTHITSKDSAFLKLNTNNHNSNNRVGIKFDNISAGKYFVLIHVTQRHAVVSKAMEESDDLVLAGSHVTPEENDLVGVYGRNEPSVL